MDLAFFVVNFNYTKDDYLNLTPKEKAFIMKAWENNIVQSDNRVRDAHFNATANFNRGKNKKWVDLWNKKPKELDKDVAVVQLKAIEKIEEEAGKSWVDKIYNANGMRKPRGGK